MHRSVIILGAGGHAKVIADIISKSGDQVIGFLDDSVQQGTNLLGFAVLGKISSFHQYIDSCFFIIGIGSNEVRRKIDRTFEAHKVNWYQAIHPSAVLSVGTEIGEGTVIMANVAVNASAQIGRHCIINTGAIVEHDDVIGDYTHLSPNSALGGKVSIGSNVHIGISATVKNGICIADNCIIGAGAVVVKNITEPGIYIGVPARRMSKN